MKKLLLFFLVIPLIYTGVFAAESPILEIDTGGHKAKINDVIFARDGRHLISASDDKTVRVWDVETGEIVRIIRGQIGEGDEGKIFAAALSPDNRMLAVGGYPSRWGIRLIDFQTGKVIRLLKGHTNVIFDIAFSPDGSQLISGGGDFTARIWDVRSGRNLHILEGHTDSIYTATFSPDGKVAVTGSDDDTLKLWNVTSGELITTMLGHNDDVLSAAFTPDGRYILSGSSDKTIRMWDGKSGEFIKVLVRQDSEVPSLSISPDGKKVVTGHSGSAPFTNNVFSISTGELLNSFTKHENIVIATAISPDGKTTATGGGNDQEIYIWDIDTGRVKQKMAGKGGVVWSVGFAKDGRSIAWGKNTRTNWTFNKYGYLEQSFLLKDAGHGFSLSMGDVVQNDIEYQRAIESVGELSIKTKDGTYTSPILQILKNGNVIHEITRVSTSGYDHRSLTLTSDGRTVISGGSFGVLTSYNPNTGKKINDFIGHTSDVWGVAASPDSRYLVSGSYDQTVKIWKIESGELLLTIFHSTDGEWVAWTPDGFYTSSSGGAHYVGYHINRGEDRASDYVGLDQIGDIYYRPDLVAKRLQGGFEDEIRAELARVGSIDEVIVSGLPPKVVISKKNYKINKRDFTLNFSLEDQGGGIGKIEYRVNDVIVASTGATRSEDFLTKRRSGKILTLPNGKSTIKVITYNKRGNIALKSEEIIVEVNDPHMKAPSLYVLAVGVTDYRDRALKLNFAHSDAQAISDELKIRGKGLFEKIKVITLKNKDATTKKIEKAFDDISRKVKVSDVFVLYLAGHGMSINGDYHFVPWEAVYASRESFEEATLSNKEIASLLEKIDTSKSLIILDSCYAGLAAKPDSTVMLAMLTRGIEEKTAIDRLMRATGRATLAASSEKQQAIEGYKGYGVFTYALIQGLRGKADRPGKGKGEIRIDELAEYVGEEVPRITMKQWGYEQIPMPNISGTPFSIAIVKE